MGATCCCFRENKKFKLPEENQIDVKKSSLKENDLSIPRYSTRSSPFTSINDEIFEEN